jgi:hypothetical protein
MISNQTTHYLEDINIDPESIPTSNVLEHSEDAIALAPKLKEGEYITLPNKNDLSEVLIYRKSNFQAEDISILRWDGRHVDTSWFMNDGETDEFFIRNAEQFAGLQELVDAGNTFENKIIHLTTNIDLGDREWEPIGENYEVERLEDDYFRVHIDKDHTFSGTIDGGNHVIYGLKITTSDISNHQYFTGIFRALNKATIKNLSLQGVHIGSVVAHAHFAPLFGYARNSKFINITIDGSIIGQNCSSLGGTAIDCSFTECINRARIELSANENNRRLHVGGFVEYMGLSSSMIKQVQESRPKIFDRCLQAGSIFIDAKNAISIVGGQLFGTTLFKKSGKPYGFTLDHCTIFDGAIPVIRNFDEKSTMCVIYAKDEHSKYPRSILTCVGNKIDLLGGLIGKANINISISVIQVTRSTKLDSMIIPGSVNTLRSPEFLNSFTTSDVGTISSQDVISNLRPYYTFIKSTKI